MTTGEAHWSTHAKCLTAIGPARPHLWTNLTQAQRNAFAREVERVAAETQVSITQAIHTLIAAAR